MAVSANMVTVTGSSASFDVNASGSGFGIFSSYSAYASQALGYDGNTASGVGSFSLSLDASFGSLVFSGTDTISASSGGYVFSGSETLSFVTGADTVSFATATVSGAGSTFADANNDLNNFYSSIMSIGGVTTLSDSIAAAAAADVSSNAMTIISAATPTVAGGASVMQQGVQFNFTKLS